MIIEPLLIYIYDVPTRSLGINRSSDPCFKKTVPEMRQRNQYKDNFGIVHV